jgi:hypothetical protein
MKLKSDRRIRAVKSRYRRYRTQYTKPENNRWWVKLKDPITFFTAILAAGTVALVVTAVFQWLTFEKTDRTLRDTLVANNRAQRAFVSFNFDRGSINTIENGQIIGISIQSTIKNSGNTTTKSMMASENCGPYDLPPVDPWNQFTRSKPEPVPIFVGPKEEVPFPCRISRTTLDDIYYGRKFGYIMLVAVY